MLQARNKKRMPFHWWLLRNPFLFAGLLGALAQVLLTWVEIGAVWLVILLEWLWLSAGFAHRLAGGLLERLLPGLPSLMALLMGLAIGLLICLLMDYFWRRLLSLDD
ncbi:MAG: hypothetical protein JJU31_05560 [Wenzhouxiangella sp.]|nr:hypothetical protein [Wenzhouxiangella sp.]TVR91281.1 MAG: hypothetical protein EA418_14290 [Wenzhouxiangellaceae bacterium]